jgi:hypothetical protein
MRSRKASQAAIPVVGILFLGCCGFDCGRNFNLGRLWLWLWRDFVSDDDMSEHVLADLHHSLQLCCSRSFAFEVHNDVDAFAAAFDVISKPASVPLVDCYDFTAVIGDNLPILVDDGLRLLVIKQRIDNVYRFVISYYCNSPPLGLMAPVHLEREGRTPHIPGGRGILALFDSWCRQKTDGSL